MRNKVYFRLSPAFCVILALMLLTLPLKWLISAILAAAYHELCHIGAIRFCGGDIHQLNLSPAGANLNISPLPPGRELICVLAGPLGGLCLLFFSRWIPRIAVCAAFQSVYNLLPIHPLDGGRALRCVFSIMTTDERSSKLCKDIEYICLSAIAMIALYGTFVLKLGIGCLFPAILIFGHTKYRKIPCKQQLQRLQ